MKESFICYLWNHHLFDYLEVKTTKGEPLKVLSPGFYNSDAGPDFKQALVQIGEVKWAGDVEIHIRSSDWFRHKHHLDEKYKSVALHVVYEHDVDIERMPNEFFPTLEVKSLVLAGMYDRYQRLVGSLELLPCQPCLSKIDPIYFHDQISTMIMERMLRKQDLIFHQLEQCQYDWHETLYRLLAISFGFKTNATAFELLARSLPYKIIKRHADSLLQINALVFGQAGMLERSYVDTYYNSLKYEYDYLRYKYQIDPIGGHHWNWLRLRPSNFPCVRLGQFSALLYKSSDLLAFLLQHNSVDSIRDFFLVEADDYWRKHYQFGKETMLTHSVLLGKDAINLLLINTVIPILFAYYRFSGNDQRLEFTIQMLEQLPFEVNKRTRIYENTPFPKRSALDSQALMELLENYCKEKSCLECGIGERIVRSKDSLF